MTKPSFIEKLLRSRAALLWVILAVLVLFMCLKTSNVLSGGGIGSMFNSGFMVEGNLRSIFLNIVVQGMMLVGLTCLIIGGEIDLSVSGQATISAMLFAHLCTSFPDMPWGVALLACIAFGVLIGLFYTFLVNVLKFMSFIATIGMASLLAGLANVWTNANVVPITRGSFNDLGMKAFFGRFPLLFVVMLVLLVLAGFMMSHTRFGRRIYMLGGNRQAARLTGLNPNRIRMRLFIQNSVLAALAGVMWAAQMKQASPTALTSSLPDLTAITAAILGGVAFMGGKGNLAGAFAGMLLLNVFSNMLTILRVPTYWNISAQGALLIIALVLDHVSNTQSLRSLRKQSALAGAAYESSQP
ncbi:MAG: ABC transporter permease [Clostridiales Family XIII bacterium]|jgi:ribose transport system permease protein|nr:ABC transporter permease [Clostridiales Family XIII bacterium]